MKNFDGFHICNCIQSAYKSHAEESNYDEDNTQDFYGR